MNFCTLREQVRPTEKCIKDLERKPENDAEREKQILELLEAGDRMQAVKLVRKHYKYSLAQARQFVDELMGSS